MKHPIVFLVLSILAVVFLPVHMILFALLVAFLVALILETM